MIISELMIVAEKIMQDHGDIEVCIIHNGELEDLRNIGVAENKENNIMFME